MSFQGFSPDSFEQFIRALALKVLGPGVTVFGNGPDGGREATFQGKINFPHPPKDIWDGYGVIQAKFKEKTEGTQKDQAWATKQLDAELVKWKNSNKRTPKPDYYIFCTNVELSSASNGGREAVEAVFEKHKKRLGLKAYKIWDANQLKGYIDGYQEIRKRFSCFFTTGDLLAEVANVLTRVSNPESVLTAYLCREILADKDARLSQAGDRSEDRLSLANVFMDLPSSDIPYSELNEELILRLSCSDSLQRLLRASMSKLDPLALYEQRNLEGKPAGIAKLFGRYVFLGGPGSGKSTIGQFLAQIHRAALLDRRPPHRLEQKVLSAVKEIKARCEEDNLIWPTTPRYPFRLELNDFAKALASNAEDKVVTLSEYLRRNLSHNLELSHDDLRDWLKAFPWLLILDGLDEVPSSSNRREVVAEIQAFLNEARDVEADLLIVASSRQDGYAGEFDGDEVDQRYLVPLTKKLALSFAKRYVSAKAASQSDQIVDEAMGQLTRAIENPLVERLMRSPLQVTFMVTVVAASGKPSESRWQLFNDYYRIIYERELHKAVRPFDKVLNERRQDIDALHHTVGFILQYRAESSGGTQADLSIDEFEKLVSACLEENGLIGQELVSQKEKILGAAHQRLVFLTSRTPGRLSFDVRSLQEYMAAACITSADSTEVIERLKIIAHASYWRNTLIFAIGRFFAESHVRSYRDKIRVFCDDLNREDADRANVKLGSRLALEIIESGIIGNVPLLIRNLAACSLGLLAIPSTKKDAIPKRLAEIYRPAMELEFQEAITVWLGQMDLNLSLSAWMLVLYLEENGVTWAANLAAEKWPLSSENASKILRTWFSEEYIGHTRNELSEVNTRRLENIVPYVSTLEFTKLIDDIEVNLASSRQDWLFALSWWRKSESGPESEIEVKLHGCDKESGIEIRLAPIPIPKQLGAIVSIKAIKTIEGLHPDWGTVINLIDFYIDPNAKTLADTLEYFADSSKPTDWAFWAQNLPWPLMCCLKLASTEQELLNLAKQIRSGAFGTVESWQSLQDSWSNKGIPISDLSLPFFEGGPSIADGVKGISVSGSTDAMAAIPNLKALFSSMVNVSQPNAKDTIAWIIQFYANCTGTLYSLDPCQMQKHLLPARKHWGIRNFAVRMDSINNKLSEWLDFFDSYGKLCTFNVAPSFWDIDDAQLEFILNGYLENNSKQGLLRLAGLCCAAGMQVKFKNRIVLNLDNITNMQTRLAAILVLIAQPGLTTEEVNQIAGHTAVVVAESGEPCVWRIFLSAIEKHAKETPALEILLIELIKTIPRHKWQIRARAESLRNTLLQVRRSGFNDELLKRLGLPVGFS